MSLYDPDDPNAQRYLQNFDLRLYDAKQPETQRRRVEALARKIRTRHNGF